MEIEVKDIKERISDKEWGEFEEWFLSKWCYGLPARGKVELFLSWREARIKGVDWRWSFEKKSD